MVPATMLETKAREEKSTTRCVDRVLRPRGRKISPARANALQDLIKAREASKLHRKNSEAVTSRTSELMREQEQAGSEVRTRLEKLERTIWHFDCFVPTALRATSPSKNIQYRRQVEKSWMQHIVLDGHSYYKTCVDLGEDWGDSMIRRELTSHFGAFEAASITDRNVFDMLKYLWYMSEVLSLGWNPFKIREPYGRRLLENMGYIGPALKECLPSLSSMAQRAAHKAGFV